MHRAGHFIDFQLNRSTTASLPTAREFHTQSPATADILRTTRERMNQQLQIGPRWLLPRRTATHQQPQPAATFRR
jgi:hypothetical protein